MRLHAEIVDILTANDFVLAPRPLRIMTIYYFFATQHFRSEFICNSSDERMSFSLMNKLRVCQVYVSRVWHIIENSSFRAIYNSFVSPDFAKQIMPILLVSCYNGSLVA
jgi:hypothetical protein